MPTGHLRILETTDLHMQILDYDYFADHPDRSTGLVNLADTIAELRSDSNFTTLLLDNGDFLQGNPLADYVASHGQDGQPHPMIAAMNLLGYDAIGLGNHEFDYGVDFLLQTLSDAQFPVTCANFRLTDGRALSRPYAILDRRIECDDGITRPIKIGVIGFLPPQVSEWNPEKLDGVVQVDDIVSTALTNIPNLKAEGADIIVALCHSGIGGQDHVNGMENAAIPLASIDNIDVVLAGHTHELFPDPMRDSSEVVDPVLGTLHGKPTVMPGFYGNQLGIVDLKLRWDHGKWQVGCHQSRLVAGKSAQPAGSTLSQKLRKEVGAAHSATLSHIRKPIASTRKRIHSYFTTVGPDLSQRILARAQREFIETALMGTPAASYPLLTATAPYLFGGRAGPGHYIDIPAGPIALRDAAAMFPFADNLCAVRRTGAQIRAWLERSAAHYHQVTIGEHEQPLINLQSPGYNCDVIHGLSYEIDLSQPAMFSTNGVLQDSNAQRIRNLTYQAQPVTDDAMFIVAANRYRINGGGGFARCCDADILYASQDSLREILIGSLRKQPCIDDLPDRTWRFRNLPKTSATFLSAPAARDLMPEQVSYIGPAENGFDRYRFAF
ncbi:hypothetical protein TW80_08130 [Loktanella sp. S4079]|nr:hypothetical protein TW80_08130 [Loktanella sp. S4079]